MDVLESILNIPLKPHLVLELGANSLKLHLSISNKSKICNDHFKSQVQNTANSIFNILHFANCNVYKLTLSFQHFYASNFHNCNVLKT